MLLLYMNIFGHPSAFKKYYIDSLAQDYSISSVLAEELPQSHTKPLILVRRYDCQWHKRIFYSLYSFPVFK